MKYKTENDKSKKISKKRSHPEIYDFKICLPNGDFFMTVTSKIFNKENKFNLEILQETHPAWTGNFYSKIGNNKTSRTKDTDLDIFKFDF